jgi:hypothetical protein
MPIPTACSCGKSFDAPDVWAGRVIRCEQCGQTLLVPNQEVSLPRGKKPCPRCGEPMFKVLEACPKCGAWSGRRDLAMEGHLRAIALWLRVGGLLSLGMLGLMLFISSQARLPQGGMELMISGGVSLGFIVLGFALSRYSNAARIITGILTILYGLVLLGTIALGGAASIVAFVWLALWGAWSCALLWALFNSRSARICTAAYRDGVAATPDQRPSIFRSVFFWIPMGVIIFMIGLTLIAALAVSRVKFSLGGNVSKVRPARALHDRLEDAKRLDVPAMVEMPCADAVLGARPLHSSLRVLQH